jgi:transcription-repair coupling factor (superfamily II helicase)
MTVLSDIAEFKEELVDRYGTMPVEATNLLLKIMLKVLSIKAGVKRLELKSRNLTLSFSEVHQKHPFGIIDMVTSSPGLYKFTPDSVLKARLPKTGVNNALAKTKNILKEIAQHVNC